MRPAGGTDEGGEEGLIIYLLLLKPPHSASLPRRVLNLPSSLSGTAHQWSGARIHRRAIQEPMLLAVSRRPRLRHQSLLAVPERSNSVKGVDDDTRVSTHHSTEGKPGHATTAFCKHVEGFSRCGREARKAKKQCGTARSIKPSAQLAPRQVKQLQCNVYEDCIAETPKSFRVEAQCLAASQRCRSSYACWSMEHRSSLRAPRCQHTAWSKHALSKLYTF